MSRCPLHGHRSSLSTGHLPRLHFVLVRKIDYKEVSLLHVHLTLPPLVLLFVREEDLNVYPQGGRIRSFLVSTVVSWVYESRASAHSRLINPRWYCLVYISNLWLTSLLMYYNSSSSSPREKSNVLKDFCVFLSYKVNRCSFYFSTDTSC